MYVLHFTFHYVSINTKYRGNIIKKLKTLHSTMFLLIHICVGYICKPLFIFTFHYVSINTSI